MRMPKEENIELPLLKVLKDAGGSLNIRDAITKTKELYPDLTTEEKTSMLSSGENRLNNRIAWCRQGLVDSGDIDSSVRGIWRITEQGKRNVESGWASWRPDYVEITPRVRVSARGPARSTTPTAITASPTELLDSTIDGITENVKAQILKNLKEVDPSTFENIVAQLLEKLGYGNIEDGSIKVTGRSHDGGIDGICSLDKLGLGKAIFQAKKWDNNVGIEPVSRLAGTVHSRRVSNGIMITTADFTADAKAEAARAGNVKLINGQELAGLMISIGLGVNNINISYPKVDEDYFEGL